MVGLGRVAHRSLSLCCHKSGSTYSIALLITNVVFLKLEDNGTAQHRGPGHKKSRTQAFLLIQAKSSNIATQGEREVVMGQEGGSAIGTVSFRDAGSYHYPDAVSLDLVRHRMR